MTTTALALPLTRDQHHAARCSVLVSGSGGWDILFEIDDRLVFKTHCTEWHRVERRCAELKGQCGDACAQSFTYSLH